MTHDAKRCSFCGKRHDADNPLITGTEGHIGEDGERIIARLLDAADGNKELAEWGIAYIDEIDKLAPVPAAVSPRGRGAGIHRCRAVWNRPPGHRAGNRRTRPAQRAGSRAAANHE
jgi:hypothetical protein